MRIDAETDANKKLGLIEQQNVLLSYVSGLGIAVNNNENAFIIKMKGGILKKEVA